MLDGAPVAVECGDEAAACAAAACAAAPGEAAPGDEAARADAPLVDAEPGDAADWQVADRALRRIAARRAALDIEEADWLLRGLAAEVHRHRGFASFAEYLERELGYAPHTARDRVRVAQALPQLPATRAALQLGMLPWSAVRELTRVATADTEQKWLDAAANRTVREIEDAVRGRRPGDSPDTPPAPDARTQVMRMELAPTTVALLAEVRRDLERRTGQALSDDEVQVALCRMYLAGGGGEPSPDGEPTHNQPPHQIAITTCATCQRAWRDVAGRTIEISATELEQASCDATHVGRVDGVAPEPLTRSIPPATRRAVLRRDRGRCVVPGCRNSRHVDVHHVVPRAVGGAHAQALLVTMCSTHHGAVHHGRLWLEGDAIRGLSFTHADGRPYGQLPADDAPPSPPGRSDDATVRATLIELGFPATIATAACTRGRAHVGRGATLETLMVAALRACRAPS